jgi:hypothetical protein
MGAPVHGKNARVQIDTDVISNAYQWDLTQAVPSVEVGRFGETATRNVPGQRADSGTITAWQPIDAKVLNDARGADHRIWIYPNYSSAPTAYWYGVMLCGDYGASGSTTSAVGATLAFSNGNTDSNGMVAYGFT